jgi:hypothetical protein
MDYILCPKCFAAIPASEDCDVCSEVVDRRDVGLLDLFVVVMDRDHQVVGYRHPWCDVKKQLKSGS